jgi:hypothetical protein
MDTTWNELESTMLQALICYPRLILAPLISFSMSLVEVYVFISKRPLSDHVEQTSSYVLRSLHIPPSWHPFIKT